MRIISGFPGVGKSYLTSISTRVSDSDSTNFSWVHDEDGNRSRNPEWPQNYMKHLESLRESGDVDMVFVSSHKEVRDALVEAKLAFTLAYPNVVAKEIYLERYRQRGSPEAFIRLVEANWETWIDELKSQEGCSHVVLGKEAFLSDALPMIMWEG